MAEYSRTGLWSLDSLAHHILGEMAGARDASGSAPDRMLALVAVALRDIWQDRDWWWKRKTGTLSVSANDTEEALADDFDKIDSKWINDRERSSSSGETDLGLVFTDDLSLFQEVKDRYDPDTTGEPAIACIVQDTSETSYMKWKALLAPTSDADYDYTYVYIPICPLDLEAAATLHKGTGEQILMPPKFHEGWRIRARQKILPVFSKVDVKDLKKEWDEWMKEAVAEHDRRIVDPPTLIRDAYGDFAALPGAGTGRGVSLRRMRGTVFG